MHKKFPVVLHYSIHIKNVHITSAIHTNSTYMYKQLHKTLKLKGIKGKFTESKVLQTMCVLFGSFLFKKYNLFQ